ncbi:MAG: hypothetical protein KUL75_05725 [Sterolibacterium sp.]|nr:hypothetical protein [Sterolibacterium sp.]
MHTTSRPLSLLPIAARHSALTLAMACILLPLVFSACASQPDRYKLPPPRNTQPLPSAQGSVYGQPAARLKNPTDRCITSAGHCPLPATTESGLPCTCDSRRPEFSYGGRTGPIPAMPDWADPRLKHKN